MIKLPSLCLGLGLASLAIAQDKTPVTSVAGVKGVPTDAIAKVKNVQSGTTTGTKNTAQGVNKINGIDTINGVKADGRTAVLPPTPVVQPVISGAGSIQAVHGVTGINAAKLQNLESALLMKHETGPHDGKGKAAAAALGGPSGRPGKAPRDGRDGFQEFEKLKTNGS
jgi:hypothetical protein